MKVEKIMGKKSSLKVNQRKKNIKQKNSLGPAFFVIPAVLLIFIYAIIFSITEDGIYFYISPVFQRHAPIEKTNDAYLENYFSDEVGFFEEERYRIINESAEYFYDKTGIKIFLYTVPAMKDENDKFVYPTDEEAEKSCADICKEFSAEGIDLVIMFMPTQTGFKSWTYATNEVRGEFGSKCERVLEQKLVRNFHIVGEYDELFWYSYRESADRLMGGITSPLVIINENLRFFILFGITVGVIYASVVFYRKIGKKI